MLSRGRSGHDFISAVRRAEPRSLVTALHPHSISSSYLRDGGLDAYRDKARPGFSYDFDAIEIFNGYHRFSFGNAIKRNMRNWFWLLDHGHMIAAVGGSDTHWMRGRGGQAGYPRTLVRVGQDVADKVTPYDVVDTIKALRAQVTSGPVIDMKVGKTDIGDLAPVAGGKATVTIRVRAAPWVPTTRLTLYVNGRIVETIRIPKSTAAVRLRISRVIELERDGYVVAKVDAGKQSLWPVAGEHEHRIPSLALTNPIFLDVNGNGRFDPPRPHGKHAPLEPVRRRRAKR